MSKISVVIPTKNAGGDFPELLRTIREQEAVPAVEIIVIDSGSTDGTIEIAEQLADELIEIPPEEFHHGKTRNRGASVATGEIIVFTVQDAYPNSNDWLSTLTRPIVVGDADVTYGNQVAHKDAKPPDKFFYQYFYPDEQVQISQEDTLDEGEFYLDNIFLSDVSSAISREVWDGFQFRDSVSMSEDKDFAYRVAKAGYTLQYCPEAKVRHSHNYSLRSLFYRRYKDGIAFDDIATSGSDNFLSDGIRYILSEYCYLIQSGHLAWVPYSILYDLTYFVAFTLGKSHERLPAGLHRKLSA
ncbi:glycosyltransferase family 2 protein [Haloferax volcanii]|uniref:Glycosyltransferase n=1 Tax=Haloferax volcanii TaxID=2246 RepID=A0A558GAH0_HALVO|nr:glycosyltransferase [Haloferax volcanii]TVT94767.1 glycosyltransferase [Haloferax volcanii]